MADPIASGLRGRQGTEAAQIRAALAGLRQERREQLDMLTTAIRVGRRLGVNVLASDASVPLSYVLDFDDTTGGPNGLS